MNPKASPALLEIKLPSTIVVPLGCDLNAFFDFMSRAKAVEPVHASDDPDHSGNSVYAGESTYYTNGPAIPQVTAHEGKIYDSKADAQLAKNEIVTAELAARLARASAGAKEAA